MKNERRHELETNYLADRLGGWVEKAKPYTSVAALGLVAILVAILASSFFSKQSAAKNEKNWEAYYRTSEKPAQDRDGFLKAADAYEGTPIEPWAALAAADAALHQGCSLLWIDKSESTKHLNAASADYEAISKSVDDELLKERATFSLAVCQEALGKLPAAIESYRKVKGALGKKAAERADTLSSSDNLKSFYDWYAKAELPTFGPPAGAGTPGQKPEFEIDSDAISPFLTPEAQPDTSGEDSDAASEAVPESETAPESESPPITTDTEAAADAPLETPAETPAEPAGPAEAAAE